MGVETYADLAARVQATPISAGTTRVVAVDGPAGSGKTNFAARLGAFVRAPIVHVDDLCPGWTGLDQAASGLIQWVLAPLATGGRARYRRYDWDRASYAEWHEVPDGPVLIVEGVASGSRAAARYLSLLIWVEAPPHVRMARGIERDGEAYRSRWELWSAQEEAIFATEGTLERADLIVDGAPTALHDPEREFVTARSARPEWPMDP